MPRTYSQDELLNELRQRVAASSQRQVAQQLGISTSMMNDLMLGRRDVSDRIAKALGYQRAVVFRKVA